MPVLYFVEKFFKKVMPDVLSTVFTPFCTMIVTIPIAFIVLAPIGNEIGSLIANALFGLADLGGIGILIVMAILGAFWQLFVVCGMHMPVILLAQVQIIAAGYDPFVFVSTNCAMAAVWGCAFGAFLKMRNPDEKGLALGYVISAIAAGVLFDLRGRSYMNIGMTCAAMLSTLSFFVLIIDGNGGNELAATIIFFLGSGFFVVFFTTKFAAISLYARWSYFWPCMGRVVNNVCSMLVTAPAVAIILSQNVLAAVGAALVMFVGIAITLLGQLGQRADDVVMQDGLPLATDDLGGDLAPTCSDPEPVEAAELTSDERLDAFVATFELTERERDVLEALVVSDQSVQDIATTLFLSRSTLYRHISSINKKTGTTSRVALINFFWSWTPKD